MLGKQGNKRLAFFFFSSAESPTVSQEKHQLLGHMPGKSQPYQQLHAQPPGAKNHPMKEWRHRLTYPTTVWTFRPTLRAGSLALSFKEPQEPSQTTGNTRIPEALLTNVFH